MEVRMQDSPPGKKTAAHEAPLSKSEGKID
jgi:hypothetical protein